MFINEIISCGIDELYMFLAVEMFCRGAVSLYLFMCVLQSLVWMCVDVDVSCVLVSNF